MAQAIVIVSKKSAPKATKEVNGEKEVPNWATPPMKAPCDLGKPIENNTLPTENIVQMGMSPPFC